MTHCYFIPVVLDQLVGLPQKSFRSHSFCFCLPAVQSHLLPVVTQFPPPQVWSVLLIRRRLFDMFDIRLFLFALSCQLNIRHIPTESGTDA